MARPYLSVIIPAWNEASRLPLTLIDIDRHLAVQDFTSEIIVALSPSADNSAEILNRFQSIIKNLKVITLIENQGKGFALRQGMQAARGVYRLTMEADNSTAVIEVAKMLPLLTAATDPAAVVVGSRYLPGSNIDPKEPWLTRCRSAIQRTVISSFITRKLSDPTSAFICLSAHTAETIIPQTVTNGWALETEILARAQRMNINVKEVPVYWSYDLGSHSRSSLLTILEYIRLWWHLLLSPRSRKQA